MTGNPASVSVLALAGCLVYLGILTAQGTVRAESSGMFRSLSSQTPPQALVNGEPEQKKASTIYFDIARQSLALSLDQYGAATGLPVFFDSALVANRMASAVQGSYDPATALQIMLEGSGLIASSAKPGQVADAFVLKLIDTSKPATEVTQGGASGQASFRRYDGLVQTRIREAFCGNDQIVPGDYRIAIRFEIDVVGQIVRPFLLASTGDRTRDTDVIDTLKKVRIDYAPPKDLAQPFTMVILPRALVRGAECSSRHP